LEKVVEIGCVSMLGEALKQKSLQKGNSHLNKTKQGFWTCRLFGKVEERIIKNMWREVSTKVCGY
jgi:hypothetical protein